MRALIICALVLATMYAVIAGANRMGAGVSPIAPTIAATAVAEPAPSFKVLSVTCEGVHIPQAVVAVLNTGPAMQYAHVYVSFGGQIVESYLEPTNIPSGSIATARLFANADSPATCELVSIQDHNGRVAVLSH